MRSGRVYSNCNNVSIDSDDRALHVVGCGILIQNSFYKFNNSFKILVITPTIYLFVPSFCHLIGLCHCFY